MAATFVDIRERYKEEFPTAMEETEILGYTDYIPGISVTVKEIWMKTRRRHKVCIT